MKDSSLTDLFVYGSLLEPRVVNAVVGREVPCKPATALGVIAMEHSEETYPLGTFFSGAVCEGGCLVGLTASELTSLSSFEGEEYELSSVECIVEDERCLLETFVAKQEFARFFSGRVWEKSQLSLASLSLSNL